jgi:superfamily II DNA/RNA helicase
VQVGLPSSREQYIHRLGRTARAGRAGRGLLVLMPEERHFLRQLQGELPMLRCCTPLLIVLSLAPLLSRLAQVVDA